MARIGIGGVLAALLLSAAAADPGSSTSRLILEPAEIDLQEAQADHGLLVTAVTPDGRWNDVTREARYDSSNPKVAVVGADGRVHGGADGEAEITATFDGQTARTRVRTRGTAASADPSFRHEVVPLLTRYGCNQGSCHGKEAGQNGFKLSLRGFAPEQDYVSLILESRGRRMNHAAPALSLFLAKPTGRLPHRGGELFSDQSRAFEVLARWIGSGTPGVRADEATLTDLELLGGGRTLRVGQHQQLLLRGRFSDGSVRDVTWLAKFFSNDSMALEVNASGRVRALREGASTVRAHFQDLVAVAAFTLPREKAVDAAAYGRRNNEIDRHVFERLEALRIPPSAGCSDEEFIRRAFLDAIGTLPRPDEVVAFLEDKAADKRARLIDALLARPEFVDYWAQILGDLLQNRKERDHDVRGSKGVRNFHQWLREQIARNRPWNELARDVLTAVGDTAEQPQIGYFVVTVGEQRQAEKSDVVSAVAQSFLGTRILCAKCHNHPDERYTQDDYYHFAAFFSAVSLDREKPEKGPTRLAVMGARESEERRRAVQLEKQVAEQQKTLAGKPEAEAQKIRKQIEEKKRQREEAIKKADEARRQPVRITQPRTGKPLAPQPLDRASVALAPGEDPRKALADWITSPANEYFTGSMVNRLWRHYLGVGLVEPVDDLRSSNPPTNAALWRHLNDEFVKSGFDLRHVMRIILNSRAYQLSSATLPENETDRRFYSRYYPKRLSAEVLLDAISQASGVPDSFQGYPVGVRAVQLPDAGVESHFLKLFGRSDRVTACACERNGDVTLPQLLHLQNGDSVVQKMRAPDGRLASLLKAEPDPVKIVDTLFLATLARRPRPEEQHALGRALASGDHEDALRDVFWSLLNTKEFVFNH